MDLPKAFLPLIAAAVVAAVDPSYLAIRSTASVGGAYGLVGEHAPAPAPTPSGGCGEDCRCNGTGKEKSGDGIIEFDCACGKDADCKKKSEPAPAEPVCTSGTCGPVSKSSTVVRRRPPVFGRIFR